MISWSKLSQNRLLDVAAIGFAIFSVIHIAIKLPEAAVRNDFAHYYLTSRLLLDGKNPYTTPLEPLYVAHGYVFHEAVPIATNPPTLLWLFAPFALLPPQLAFATWVFTQAVSLIVILLLTRRLLGERLSARAWRFVCAAAISSAAVHWHFYYSQVQLLLAAVVLAGYVWKRNGKDDLASVAITAAGLVKLYPLALLPWFVWRGKGGPMMRIRRAGASLVLIVAAFFFTGFEAWSDFLTHARKVLADDAVNYSFNFTLPSFVLNLGFAASNFNPSQTMAQFWWMAACVTGLGAIGLAYAICLRRKIDADLQFCLLCVVMLLATITAWGHYFVYLIFPVALAAVRVVAVPSVKRVVWISFIFFALNHVATHATHFLDRNLYIKILVNYVPLYGLVALGVFFTKEIHASREVSPQ